MEEELKESKSRDEELTILRKKYTCLYVFALRSLGKEDELEDFTNMCKKYKKGKAENYSIYIHGYLLPWLEEQRATGQL